MRRTARIHLDLQRELGTPTPHEARADRAILHVVGETPAHTHRRERHAMHQHLHDVLRGGEPDEDVLEG